MKLIRLRLENFRQHRDTTVEFRDGMTAIVGDNGSGKSTLLEAITFALFGEQRQNKDSIRFHWAGPRERFRSELTFEFGGRRYVVERGEKGAELRADGNVVAEGLREVKGACERLLKLTHDQFINSFCAEQKSLEFLKFKDRATRQNEVARMLGLDRLKQASELAKQQAKVLKNKAEYLGEEQHGRERLEAAAKLSRERVDEERRRHTLLGKRLPECAAALETGRKRSDEAARWLDLEGQIRERAGTQVQAQTRLESLREEIATLERDASAFASLAESEAEYLAALGRLESMDSLARQHHEAAAATALRSKRLEEIEADRRLLGEAAVATVADIDSLPLAARAKVEALERDLRERKDAWQETHRELVQTHARATALRDAARTALARSERMTVGSTCPECGQTIEKNYAHLVRERSEALEAAEAALAQEEQRLAAGGVPPEEWDAVEAALKEAREQVLAAESRAKELREAWTRVAQFDSEASPQAATTPVYDAKGHADLRTRVKELLPIHERAVRLHGSDQRLAAAKAKVPALEAQIAEGQGAGERLRVEQAALEFESPDAARQAQENFRKLEVEQAKLQAEIVASERVLEAAERELQAAAKQLQEYEDREKRIAEYRVDQIHFEAVTREMMVLREKLNQQIRPDLEARASDNLQALTGGRYAALQLDEQFEATVLDDGVEKAVISGGEEDIVALSLRLALSELIQERQGTPLSLLILDEVFGSLDGERRQLVMERLAGLKGRFDQVLVISHIEEINQVADQCVYLHRDENTKSTYASDAPITEAPILLL
ncbi:MAG: SMC family ATPase [Fimbriimonadaceae bacterium]|nr:SMC family ATPase [Fimbriimonadaceae bacterium]